MPRPNKKPGGGQCPVPAGASPHPCAATGVCANHNHRTKPAER